MNWGTFLSVIGGIMSFAWVLTMISMATSNGKLPVWAYWVLLFWVCVFAAGLAQLK